MSLNVELISGGTPNNGVLPSTWQYSNVAGTKNGFNINPKGVMAQSSTSSIMDYSNNLKLSFDLLTSYYNIQNSCRLDLFINFSSGRNFKVSIPIQYTSNVNQTINYPIKVETDELVSSWSVEITNSDDKYSVLINNISLFLGEKENEDEDTNDDYEDSSGSYVDEYSKWDTICGTKDVMETIPYSRRYYSPKGEFEYSWLYRNHSQGRVATCETHKQSPKRVKEGVFGIRALRNNNEDNMIQFCKMNDSFNVTHTYQFKSPQFDLDYKRSPETRQDISWVVFNNNIYIASWVVGYNGDNVSQTKGTIIVRKLDLKCKLISEFRKVFTSTFDKEIYIPYGTTHVSIMVSSSKIKCIVKGLTDNREVTQSYDYTELLFTHQGTLLSRICRIDKKSIYGATRCGNKWYVIDKNHDSFHQLYKDSIGIGVYDYNLNRIDYIKLTDDVETIYDLDNGRGSEIAYWDSYSEDGKLVDRGVCLLLVNHYTSGSSPNSRNKLLVYSESGKFEINSFPYDESFTLNMSGRIPGEFTCIKDIYTTMSEGGQCQSVTFNGLTPIVKPYISNDEYIAKNYAFGSLGASCCVSGGRLWFSSHWWTDNYSYMQDACPENPLQRFYYKTDTEQLFLNVNGKWKNILGDTTLLRSPNGTQYILSVNDDGTLSTKKG